ncbi:hypothetical protein AMS68_004870 [Peltaster fructicola]|uniref:Replication protein A C-terminal domain-containing protein n=1 Tax=Peltaster fructicola TaxID=286661 RepID=A0A6H0XX73_9PEZI|nr:hypothetical protein AMS68_004870 [Peltaster fructicola]
MDDYTTTSYGAHGGANGGGFMPGSQGGDGAQAKRGYGKDSLRPVTIKQLIDAQHPSPDADHFMIDEQETTQVTFVAQIRNISQLATNHTYKMDDGTGVIEVKVWVDADMMSDPDNPLMREREKLVENSYARVFGRLKEFNDKRHVGSNTLRPVTDFNEIQYHLLEATYVHLLATRGPASSAQAKAGANGIGGGHNANSNGQVLPLGATEAAIRMFQCIKTTPQQNEGLHAENIASRTGMELNEVLKAGDELASMGKIYTTVDERTWALLDV